MGVLNVTPDSFYDGGQYFDPRAAQTRIDRCLTEGADVIDVGGESSRPRSEPVAAREQIRRIEPAVKHAARKGALVSIDTTSAEVADAALGLGASIVNDVSCLTDDELARVAAKHSAPIIIMHCRGTMSDMTGFSEWPDDAYGDVVADVLSEWEAARERAMAAGVPREDVWLDPGLGFAKNARHSFELLSRLRELEVADAPIVVGPGRKSFIAAADPAPPEQRLGGTVAACVLAAERGATLVRVHDVREVKQALAVTSAARPPATEAPAHA